ncbi:MAG: hypothetical protein ACYTGZ_08960 [Planctomycetota bacterium]|jgi:hypothetical protein
MTEAILAVVPASDFFWLIPLSVSIALVSSAAHREEMGEILRHAAKSTAMLFGGLLVFMVAVSYLFEWLLP